MRTSRPWPLIGSQGPNSVVKLQSGIGVGSGRVGGKVAVGIKGTGVGGTRVAVTVAGGCAVGSTTMVFEGVTIAPMAVGSEIGVGLNIGIKAK